jgi:hypothetical protein
MDVFDAVVFELAHAGLAIKQFEDAGGLTAISERVERAALSSSWRNRSNAEIDVLLQILYCKQYNRASDPRSRRPIGNVRMTRAILAQFFFRTRFT